MAHVQASSNNRSDYRREENEVMHAGPPLDLSFKNATKISELFVKRVKGYRVGKLPEKTESNKYLTSSLWLSNNFLTSTAKLRELADRFLESSEDLRWLDLAYNHLSNIEDEILEFKNLTILYLHGNKIADVRCIVKLRVLPHLRTLTLHGNPIEQMPDYRRYIIAILPCISNLDFSPVIATEKRRALPTGFFKTIPVDL